MSVPSKDGTDICLKCCRSVGYAPPLLQGDGSVEDEVFGAVGVLQAVGMTFRTIQAIPGTDRLYSHLVSAGCLFHYAAAAAEDEDHLAAVFMRMHSDGRAGNQSAAECAIGAVEVHVGAKLLFASLELRQDAEVHFVESYDHNLSESNVKAKLAINRKNAYIR